MKNLIKTMITEKPANGFKSLPALAMVVLAAALLFGVRADGLAQENANEAEAVTNPPQITGFRSARFGMSESETLKAMRRDFKLDKESVATQTNNEDRTSSLVATVDDIFPGSAPAQVAYIHGYRHNKLVQINVLWGAPVTAEVDRQSLVSTANILRNYFLDLGFDPENTVINTRIDDRVLIVFRANDDQGRMVLLQLISNNAPAAEGEEEEGAEPRFRVDSLLLSYIEDINDPDIFRIKKGDF